MMSVDFLLWLTAVLAGAVLGLTIGIVILAIAWREFLRGKP